MEEWKNINGFDGHYQISNFGRIRSTITNKILKCTEHRKEKYLKITLTYRKKVYGFWVNRLVLIHFRPIESPENFQAHHIDSNRENNRLDNLTWVTREENNKMRKFTRQHKESYLLFKKLRKKYDEENLIIKLNQIL